MKVAIHNRKNSFSQKWIEYCEKNSIQYKIVNCYSHTIISDLDECEILLWHWPHHDPKGIIFARQLTLSLEKKGMVVFPNHQTSWHYDDKIGQKYLFDALHFPQVNTFIFYDKDEALSWSKTTTYPKVFKLRAGASSQNVKLVHTQLEAQKLINKCFGKGFNYYERTNAFKESWERFKQHKNKKTVSNLLKSFKKIFFPHQKIFFLPKQINYTYFQDFIPNNTYDIRVIVIGKRAFAIKRYIRKDDFRASGSGYIDYDPNAIPHICIQIAFESTKKLEAQCIAYDFIFLDGKPKIVEISYAFSRKGYLNCQGYWTDELEWIEGSFHPEYFILEDILKSHKQR